MKKNLLLLLCLFCLVNVCHAKAKDTFTVFQLNLWHGCTKVPNGDQGIIDVLDQMDADVVFLCEIRDGKQFIPHVIEELEKKPKNVLIYATSNRRHLIRETFRDKQDRDEDMHTNDTVQEKLSLVARFGVTIYFGSPDKKAFQEIVRVLAKKNGINMPEEQLLLEANAWELSHGGLSGRTAQQFIDYLAGRE